MTNAGAFVADDPRSGRGFWATGTASANSTLRHTSIGFCSRVPVKFRVSRRRCNFLPLLAGHTSSGRLLWLGDFSQ
jgi:hypothetical protein